jgi:hypothetical protein
MNESNESAGASTSKVEELKKERAKEKKEKKREATPSRKAASKKRDWSRMVKKDQLSRKALSLITKGDELETKIELLRGELEELLLRLREELGNASFEHPEAGPWCIMERGDKVFWRAKPYGGYQGRQKKEV